MREEKCLWLKGNYNNEHKEDTQNIHRGILKVERTELYPWPVHSSLKWTPKQPKSWQFIWCGYLNKDPFPSGTIHFTHNTELSSDAQIWVNSTLWACGWKTKESLGIPSGLLTVQCQETLQDSSGGGTWEISRGCISTQSTKSWW